MPPLFLATIASIEFSSSSTRSSLFLEGAARANVFRVRHLSGGSTGSTLRTTYRCCGAELNGASLLPPDRQEDGFRRRAQGTNCVLRIRNVNPAITRKRLPGRSAQRENQHPRLARGSDCIHRNDVRVRVRRIHQDFDPLGTQVAGKPVGTAESAAPDGNRLSSRKGCATGKRHCRDDVGAARRGQAPARGPRSCLQE